MSGGGSLKLAHDSRLCRTSRALWQQAIRERASAMKAFASPSFFRTFDLLLSTTNPGREHSRGMFDSVEWERERHSFASQNYKVALEVFTPVHPGRDGWKLMVIKEFWWAGTQKDVLKSIALALFRVGTHSATPFQSICSRSRSTCWRLNHATPWRCWPGRRAGAPRPLGPNDSCRSIGQKSSVAAHLIRASQSWL